MTKDAIGGLRPQYQTYTRQKCFVAYSENAYWSVDLLSACEEVLSQPEYNLEVDYARKHFAADMPLRQKALELIANARYGIYDLSYWRPDERSPWQMPRNVMIELGIAIALNRPILLLRHASNRELPLPKGLQGISNRILEFSGTSTLKKVLVKYLPQWIHKAPETAWWNRYCTFGGCVCDYREAHPKAKQLGKKDLGCTIADGTDLCRPDFRSVVEDVLNRFGDVSYTYLDSLSLKEGYSSLLCSHCQMARSSPFAIYRISPHTPEEAFILIGISLALETQFEYKIPRILITRNVQDIPSLLADHEVCPDWNDRERKTYLRKFIPEVIRKTRQTSWKPRPLAFIELSANQLEEIESHNNSEIHEDSSKTSLGIYVGNLSSQVTFEDIAETFREYGTVNQIDLPIDSQTGNRLDFALVEMMMAKQVQEAVEALNGSEWIGRVLEVKTIKPEELIRLRTELDLTDSSSKSEPKDYSDVLEKLQKRRSGKVRIYELSRDLNLDNRDILFICNQLKIRVKSHSSTISISEAERIIVAADRFTPIPRRPQILEVRSPSFVPTKKPQILEVRSSSVKPVTEKNVIPKSPVKPISSESSQTLEKQQITELAEPPTRPSLFNEATVESSQRKLNQRSTSRFQGHNRSIYVGNLSYEVTLENVRQVFSEYGKVVQVQLPTNRETRRPRGFAFVEMATEAGANIAIEMLNGAEWMGREMRVSKARPRS